MADQEAQHLTMADILQAVAYLRCTQAAFFRAHPELSLTPERQAEVDRWEAEANG